jgi:hypothetical protein
MRDRRERVPTGTSGIASMSFIVEPYLIDADIGADLNPGVG